jgi:hypothetical protein
MSLLHKSCKRSNRRPHGRKTRLCSGDCRGSCCLLRIHGMTTGIMSRHQWEFGPGEDLGVGGGEGESEDVGVGVGEVEDLALDLGCW